VQKQQITAPAGDVGAGPPATFFILGASYTILLTTLFGQDFIVLLVYNSFSVLNNLKTQIFKHLFRFLFDFLTTAGHF